MKILVKVGKYYQQNLTNEEFDLKQVRANKLNPYQIDGKTYADVLDPQELPKKVYKTIEVIDYEIIQEILQQSKKENSAKSVEQLEIEIKEKFSTMVSLYNAVFHGAIKSLIVSGPAGVGKSHSVENKLKLQSSVSGYTYSIIKGHATPLYIFEHLKEHCQENHIVVFDDCDTVFFEHSALNVLKAALDSKPKRIITWGSSRGSDEKSFEFKGGIIFLTNISFNRVTKNEVLKAHLQALASRSHYFDVSLNTNLEKYIRIKQVCEDENIIKGRKSENKKIEDEDVKIILDFVHANMNNFTELSLRLITKIADLYLYNPISWEKLIKITCFKNEFNTF